MKKTVIAAAFAATGSALAGTLFFENFQNYCDAAPGVVTDSAVTFGNDPIRACSANVQVRSDKDLLLYSDGIKLPSGNQFCIHFKFRLLNSAKATETDPAKSAFFDVILAGNNGKSQKIRIAADKVQDIAIPEIPNNKWEEAFVLATGSSAEIYITRDRKFEKVTDIKLDATYGNLNFGASADAHFALTDIKVATPEKVPSYDAEAYFATFGSLRKRADNLKESQGETLRISPAGMHGFRIVTTARTNDFSSLDLVWDDGRTDKYPICVKPQLYKLPLDFSGHVKGEDISLDDSIVSFGKKFLNFYVRPNMRSFGTKRALVPKGIDILRDWDKIPGAAEHPLDVQFDRKDNGSLDIFIDGQYAKNVSRKDGVGIKEIVFTPAKGVKYFQDGLGEDFCDSGYTVIHMFQNPRAKAFADAEYVNAKAINDVLNKNPGDVPVMIEDPADSADIAICQQGQGLWGLAYDEYLGRDPAWNFPGAVHYRLPAAPYIRAHLVIAFDDAPGKDKFLTARLSRYQLNGVGANMVGQTIVDFGASGDAGANTKAPELKEVGKIKRGDKEFPLYSTVIDLPLKDVSDFACGDGYIDFELSGKPWENFEQEDNTVKPDPDSSSAVNVFAITLEKAPVSLEVVEATPGNVFTEDESVRKTSVRLTAAYDDEHMTGTVVCNGFDFGGKEIFSQNKEFKFSKKGENAIFDFDLGQETPRGIYAVRYFLKDVHNGIYGLNAEPILMHAGRFAILPKAGRSWDKFKCPYGTWWFSVHGSPGAYEIGGPLAKKAGIRRITWNPPDKEQAEMYDVTGNGALAVPPMRGFDAATGKFKPVMVPDPADPEKNPAKKRKIEIGGEENFVAEMQKNIDKLKAKGLPVEYAMLWHETAPHGNIPEELLGLPVPEPTDKHRDMAAYLNECGRLMRKYFPDVEIQIGNSSGSIGAATIPLRAGADPQYYDRIGIENPSQVIPPERLIETGIQASVLTKEIAEHLAKHEVKINGCWEFIYRCDRDMGERKHAEWYVRDILVSLAHRMSLIAPGIYFDCTNSYYDGPWGASGILRRAPFCYPKYAYVGYAVLTSVLDDVEFVRQIPTGSTTVYALEFKRADGKYVTALWSARGEFKMEVDVGNGGVLTAMYGNETEIKGGKQLVSAGTEPGYLVTDKPVGSLAIAERTFSEDEALAASAVVAAKFENADDVELAPDMAMESRHNDFLPILKASDFTIAGVEDEEKGKCIEVTLDTSKNKEISKYITEFTTIRLKKPVAIEGRPSVIGIWVKGNSNWGQIRFEIEDANGDVFKNLSTGRAWGCDIMDWPGNLAVDFDGWSYVYQSLRPNTVLPTHSPGPVSEQWVSEGGDKEIQFPIKLRAVTVGMNRTKLDLLDFKPSVPSIRIKDAGVIGK